MSVQNRNTDTLAGDHRLGSFYDLAVFYFPPDTKRFLFALLFFSTDVRDDIFYHFRPVFEGFSCSGDCLICSSNYFVWLKFFPCSQNRRITLDGAVWFYSDESACGSQTFFLRFDNFKVFRINLRHYHRYIRCPSVGTVVGYNRRLRFCIFFFDRFDFLFGHINCGKYKINGGSYFLHFVYIHNYQFLYSFRHRSVHFPASAYGFFICFSCTSRGCCYGYYFKPRMIFQQRDESLSYHSCCS